MKKIIHLITALLFFHLSYSQGLKSTIVAECQVCNLTKTVASDIDGDKDQDLILVTSDPPRLWWLENQGIGNFDQPQILLDSIDLVYKIEVLDFDQNGLPDILIFSFETKRVSLYNQKTLKNFLATVIVDSIDQLRNLTAGDINQDKLPDFVLSTMHTNQAFTYLNRGNGTFDKREIEVSDSLTYTSAEYLIDIDQDGDSDYLRWWPHGRSIWCENVDSGYFKPDRILIESNNGYGSFIDFDKDGDLDIIVNTPSNLILKSNLGNRFINSDTLFNIRHEGKRFSSIVSFTILDADQDGEEDIFIYSLKDLHLLKRSDSSFHIADSWQIKEATYSYLAADLDKNGYPDLIGTTMQSSALFVLFNEAGKFSDPIYLIKNDKEGLKSIREADIDGDGDLDIIVSSSAAENQLSWYQNQGNGKYGTRINIWSRECTYSYALFQDLLDVSDLNSDGLPDILYKPPRDSVLRWYPNQGNGQFGIPIPIDIGNLSGLGAYLIEDLDGDQDDDLLLARYNLYQFRNDGDGKFTATANWVTTMRSPISDLILEDLNRDGLDDIIIGSNNSYWAKKNGSLFDKKLENLTIFSDDCLSFIDIDNDQDFDIVTSDRFGNVCILENKGRLHYSVGKNLTNDLSGRIIQVKVVDYGNDGDQDILVFKSDRVMLYINNGKGDFIEKLLLTESGIKDIQMAEPKQDGSIEFNIGFVNGKIVRYQLTNESSK